MCEIYQNVSMILSNENTESVFNISNNTDINLNLNLNKKLNKTKVLNVHDSDNELGSTDGDNTINNSVENVNFKVDNTLTNMLSTTVYDVRNFDSISSVVSNVVDTGMESQTFLLCNLASVVKQLVQWKQELPMVEPFYAVKCNPDPIIVKLLASLGCSFDCATMGEIDMICNKLGDNYSFNKNNNKSSNNIIYANPAKMEHMLKFAMEQKVQMTVFDGEDELYKIAKVAKSCGGMYEFKLLLRITTVDKDSVCQFSKKFGCPYKEAYHLLEVAKSLGLHVAGVSFHVGSGCGDANAYAIALSQAAQIFKWGEELGLKSMSIIDIGGGFPGDTGGYGGPGLPTFQEIATVVRKSIIGFCTEINRSQSSVRFIAEPGRYFVSASTAIATKIYSRKGGNGNNQALYVDNGVYGSFNSVVYDHALPKPKKLLLANSTIERDETRICIGRSNSFSNDSNCESISRSSSMDSIASLIENEPLIPTAIFGPTCDGLDQMCSLNTTVLERCMVGDWLIWENQGAYTHTASFVFNGFTHFPNKIHCFHM